MSFWAPPPDGTAIRCTVLVAGACVALVLSPSLAGAQASADPSREPEPGTSVRQVSDVPRDESVASALAQDFGLTLSEAERRVANQYAQSQVVHRSRTLYPDTFGGAWVDHRDAGVLVVAFTADADASLSRVLGGAAQPVAARSTTVAFTEKDLDRTADAIEQLVAAPDGVLSAVQVVRVKERANRVEVGSYGTSRLVVGSTIERLLASAVPVEVYDEEGPVLEQSCFSPTSSTSGESRDRCPAPLKGGITLANRDRSNSVCTMGFNARGGGGDYVITAGHCYNQGEVAGHNQWDLGYAAQSINSGNVDAARIYRASNFARVGASRWILDISSDAFQIRRVALAESYTDGMYVCQSGRTVYKDCGQIISSDSAAGGNSDQIESYTCLRFGESGAPMYDDVLRGQARDGGSVLHR